MKYIFLYVFRVVLSVGIISSVQAQSGSAGSADENAAHRLTRLENPANVDVPQVGLDRDMTGVAGTVVVAGNPQLAQAPLAKPSGRVLLTITGAIDNTNDDGGAKFDRDMLLKLGTSTIRTSTSWTDGINVFEGVPASDVMRAVGAHGSTVAATALNDYVVEIPLDDFERYGVVFALSMNGKELTARDKGPIWAVYPRDDFPELRNRASDKRWIWQLVKMDIR